MRDIANDADIAPGSKLIGLSTDSGDNSLTVEVENRIGSDHKWLDKPTSEHSHVGYPGATDEQLINNLYELLCNDTGLSWA